ncbi:MAG: cell division protein FtsB [Gammaproteobacteria bacterium]|nr:cell division protein FtsB [Gammaproteobacteria bacterium]MDC3098142.1 septum formation initiator family protein [Gammaproteobacteria bacterium]|tara:strand:+ start:21789 stop:22085 length:297 start_codon:yes stop_codon:yes gene_type:complete
MNTAKKFFRYLALTLLIVVLTSLLGDIFFGQFSLQENRKLETLIDGKEDELANIVEENEALKEEIILLKNNDEYVEHIARENLGLIKEGEEYIDEQPE